MPQKIHLFDKDQFAEPRPAGDVIFRAGDPGDKMYAVIDGSVDIIIHDKTVETVEAGGVLGEMALIEDKPRVATAVVKTDAKLVGVDRKRFTFLVQQNPFFALQLMSVMADRLRRMDEKL
jgi:CRP/FNR family cyclic AMP-dependent transcriptional regulator